MARLTTHVLDTARGIPAAGLRVELFSLGGTRTLLKSAATNANGRTDEPLLADGKAGHYELLFHVGAYFRTAGVISGDTSFLDQVPVRFAMTEAQGHYHVPLLVSPWSYTTYRGS
ncbi:MAG TPA: hydroxyisourate hydrolase [Alphaproteobacteria bacterium]|nr:hydroxyisourate hydrolase [Alphaproteobacteria bacterium]